VLPAYGPLGPSASLRMAGFVASVGRVRLNSRAPASGGASGLPSTYYAGRREARRMVGSCAFSHDATVL